jgi:hypothetical protein
MAKRLAILCIISLALGTNAIAQSRNEFPSSPARGRVSVCRVADPTGTPLNVRSMPGGNKIVDTLQNGTVTILDIKNRVVT